MKGLFLCALLIFGFTASATVKLTMQGNFYDEGLNPRPLVGLGWYQPLLRGTALNTWVGYGNEPFELKDDVDWFTAKTQLDFYFGRFVVAPGLAYKYAHPYDQERVYPYIKVDYVIFK